MVNKALFSSAPAGQTPPPVDAVNLAGGEAYSMPVKNALAQYAMTGTFGASFYASAKFQLDAIKSKLDACPDTEFIAKLAIWAWEQGFMKDMPAFLVAYVATRNPAILRKVFPRVMINAKMVRNFVQIMRSGQLGRKSLGNASQQMVRAWFNANEPDALIAQSVGDKPSLGDLLRMVHPRDRGDAARQMAYRWLIGNGKRPIIAEQCSPKLRSLIEFQRDQTKPVPHVDMRLLTNLKLSEEQWREVALRASWTTLRMGLNEFAGRGVFKDKDVAKKIADRLRDPEEIRRARVFPYQIYTAWKYGAKEGVPDNVRDALHDAVEIATENVPVLDNVTIFVDCSGSMSSPVTGDRGSATTAISCKEAAAVFAASIFKRGSDVRVWTFGTTVGKDRLERRDSVLSIADKLQQRNEGGTACALPLMHLINEKAKTRAIIYLSDNESWVGSALQGTRTQQAFNIYRAFYPGVKMACVDLTPNETVQAVDDPDTINIGGYSDRIFGLIAAHVAGELSVGAWVKAIEAVAL